MQYFALSETDNYSLLFEEDQHNTYHVIMQAFASTKSMSLYLDNTC